MLRRWFVEKSMREVFEDTPPQKKSKTLADAQRHYDRACDALTIIAKADEGIPARNGIRL